MRTRLLGSLTACLLAGVGVVSAHHGVSGYDMAKEVTVQGTVKEWRWQQPHTWLYLNVTRPDGTVEEWSIEGAPPVPASRQGWSSESLQTGEAVTVTISPTRTGTHAGILRSVTRANGERLVIRRPQWAGGI